MILAILACKIREASNKYGFLTELSSALLCSMLNRNCSDAERERERESDVCAVQKLSRRGERERDVCAHFFNARLMQRVFSVWQVTRHVVGEIELHSVTNLATFQTPSATFFPSKSAQTLFSFWESPVLPLSLSLHLLVLSFCSSRGREEQRFNSVKHRYYVVFLILHASISEITAQLLSLSCVYLI